MSGWPTLDRLDDERLARSLARTGAHVLSGPPPGDATAPLPPPDTDALARLVDAYAARLFDYCHALLRDQDQAARALHAALLAAYAHAGRLTDPARFRAWLYALVRNECLRRLRDPERPAERHEAPEVEDLFLDEAERTRRLATRRLVHAALGDLRGSERESLDLLLRHGLDTAEVGAVLDLPPQRAAELTRQARRRLDDALAVAVIARTGRDDCPEVAALAGEQPDGDAPLPPAAVRRLVRHIETCPVCRERRGRTVSTARLLQVLPVALMPADLRPAVLTAVSDPSRFDRLLAAADRAEPFDEDGWPLPLDERRSGEDDRPQRPSPRFWPAVAAAAAVIAIVSIAFFLMPGTSSTNASSTPHPSGSGDPESTDSPTSSSGPSETLSPTLSTSPSPSASSPTPSPHSPSPSRHSPRPPSHSAPPSGPSQTVPAGRLAVSPRMCTLSPETKSCDITVAAVGGTVTWSVSARSPLSAGGGGTLHAGETAHVTISLGSCSEASDQTVPFSPGSSVTVSWTCG
ncbi:sigma-70 family RNA polymerase sigma factor [Actinomadura rupiterrae]|uniref:sigma-70 family RNA polymerase sigma factor n=1 Tax=Actinomadura rupiterrae TaxID=559627 RepID=UPI0020A3F82F|nr:sigma-70 family RNA polymerase sigma factor [Actinomadura rupiterrae]MCP2334683.1 RNA polymerase sigma factor (sigma-70 family) [Actinomadura rupiterrae]